MRPQQQARQKHPASLENDTEIHSKSTVLSEATKESPFSKSDTVTGCLKVDYNVFLPGPSDAAPPGCQQPPHPDPGWGSGDPRAWKTEKGQKWKSRRQVRRELMASRCPEEPACGARSRGQGQTGRPSGRTRAGPLRGGLQELRGPVMLISSLAPGRRSSAATGSGAAVEERLPGPAGPCCSVSQAAVTSPGPLLPQKETSSPDPLTNALLQASGRSPDPRLP